MKVEFQTEEVKFWLIEATSNGKSSSGKINSFSTLLAFWRNSIDGGNNGDDNEGNDGDDDDGDDDDGDDGDDDSDNYDDNHYESDNNSDNVDHDGQNSDELPFQLSSWSIIHPGINNLEGNLHRFEATKTTIVGGGHSWGLQISWQIELGR